MSSSSPPPESRSTDSPSGGSSPGIPSPLTPSPPPHSTSSVARPVFPNLSTLLWFVPLLLLLWLQVRFPQIVDPQVNDSFNVDWGGRNVIFQYCQRRTTTDRNFQPLDRTLQAIPTDHLLVFLGPSRALTPSEQQELSRWIQLGGRVLYAAPFTKPQTSLPFLGLEVRSFQDPSANTLPSAFSNLVPQLPPQLPPEVADNTGELSLDSVDWQAYGHLVSTGPQPARRWLTNTSGLHAAEWTLGRGRMLVVSSDYLFSNASLAERSKRNGVLAIQLLELAGRPLDSAAPGALPPRVVFDESLNETGAPRTVALLLTPLLRPLTLQAMLLWWLFAWQGSQRFGRALPPVLTFRRRISDHTDALGNLYWRSGNAVRPLRAYITQLFNDLKLVGRQVTPQRLQTLSARSGVEVAEIERLLTLPDEVDQQAAVLPADAARMIRRLARLRKVIEQ
ncbi:MAG: DUF4350 domain-containing protein [Planctomycetaceae bacterium]